MTKKILLEGKAYNQLQKYINKRLIVKNFVYTSLADLYEDYMSYFYSTPEGQKEIKKLKMLAKNIHGCVKEYINRILKIKGLIPKRHFSLAIEIALQDRYSFVTKRKDPAIVINGISLKDPPFGEYEFSQL